MIFRSRKLREAHALVVGNGVPLLCHRRSDIRNSESTLSTLAWLFRPIDFQIVHHEISLAAFLNKDEWIGRKKPRRPEHVGVAFARAVDQPGIGMLSILECYIVSATCRKQRESSSSEMKFSPAKRETKIRRTSSRELRDLGVDVRKISVIPDELRPFRMKSGVLPRPTITFLPQVASDPRTMI